MEYRLLEALGVENDNLDGAAFNNFVAGGKDCIIKGILDDCQVYSAASNHIGIGTGELLIHGFRIKITSPYDLTFSATPAVPVNYSLVAVITLATDKSVIFNIELRESSSPLIKENLYSVEHGVYEAEIVKFIHDSNGIKDYKLCIPVLSGGIVAMVLKGDSTIVLGKMEEVEGIKYFYMLIPNSNAFSTIAVEPMVGFVYYDVVNSIFYNYTGREYSVLIDFNESGSGVDQELIDQVNQNKADIDFLKTDNARQQTDISGNTDSISAIIGNYNGILDEAVFKGVTNSSINLSDNEKTSACEWLGALQKYSSKGALRLYGVKRSDGSQIMVQVFDVPQLGNIKGMLPTYFDKSSSANFGIEMADENGVLLTGTPNQPYQAANKKFVEDLFATLNQQNAKMYLHKITINNADFYPWGDVYFNIRTSYPNEYTNDTFFTEKVYKSMLGTPYVAYANYDGGVGDKTYSSGTFYKSKDDYFQQGMMMIIGMLSYTGGTSILRIDGHHTLTDEVIEL